MSSSERLPAQRIPIMPHEPAPKPAATKVRRTPIAKSFVFPDLLADRAPPDTHDEAVAQEGQPPARVFDSPVVQAAASAWRAGELSNAASDAQADRGEPDDEESDVVTTATADAAAAAMTAAQALPPAPAPRRDDAKPDAASSKPATARTTSTDATRPQPLPKPGEQPPRSRGSAEPPRTILPLAPGGRGKTVALDRFEGFIGDAAPGTLAQQAAPSAPAPTASPTPQALLLDALEAPDESPMTTPVATDEPLAAPPARRAAGLEDGAVMQLSLQAQPPAQAPPAAFTPPPAATPLVVPATALQRADKGVRNVDGRGVAAAEKTRPERTDRVRRPAPRDLGNRVEDHKARDDVRAASELLDAIVAQAPSAGVQQPQERLARLVEELSASLQVSTQTRADRWDIRLLLKNEILPKTALHMSSDGYRLTTRFITADAEIDRMLRSNTDMLEEALRRRCRLGIAVEVERVDRLP